MGSDGLESDVWIVLTGSVGLVLPFTRGSICGILGHQKLGLEELGLGVPVRFLNNLEFFLYADFTKETKRHKMAQNDQGWLLGW